MARETAAQKRWRLDNPERVRELQRRSRRKNKGLIQLRYKERRRWLDDYKMARGCCDCGLVPFHPCVLDLDHVGAKRFEVAQGVASRSLESLRDEMSRCEVVCANCHRLRTHRRGQFGRPTGPVREDLVGDPLQLCFPLDT